VGLVASLAGAVPVAGAAPAPTFSYTGDAYGSKVTVGTTVTSGPTALVTLGCTSTADIHLANDVATVDAHPLFTSGAVTTTATTLASPIQSRTTARVEGLNMLNGLVTADVAEAVSTTTSNSGVFSLDGSESTFVNLQVGGLAISPMPAPNTRIDLPLGLGYVILNEQIAKIHPKTATLTVNMIHLFVSKTTPLATAGTEAIISHAKSDLEGPFLATLDGLAYGTKVKALDNLVSSGPSALVILSCHGTGGDVISNSLVSSALPSVLGTGTILDTATGKVDFKGATGETTSTVQALNLLSALLTADVIKADAHATTDGTTFTFTDTGSTFVNLSVSGHPEITADVAPNTQLSLAGVGTLYLHRIVRTPHSIEVRMIQLVITDAGSGLPVGTDVRVAVAEASAH